MLSDISELPDVKSLSQATAITALGLLSIITFLAKVPPVATNMFVSCIFLSVVAKSLTLQIPTILRNYQYH